MNSFHLCTWRLEVHEKTNKNYLKCVRFSHMTGGQNARLFRCRLSIFRLATRKYSKTSKMSIGALLIVRKRIATASKIEHLPKHSIRYCHVFRHKLTNLLQCVAEHLHMEHIQWFGERMRFAWLWHILVIGVHGECGEN